MFLASMEVEKSASVFMAPVTLICGHLTGAFTQTHTHTKDTVLQLTSDTFTYPNSTPSLSLIYYDLIPTQNLVLVLIPNHDPTTTC